MKQFLIAVFFLASANHAWSQTSNIQSNNQTIIRLTVMNDKGEILMRETENGWMTLSMYYNKRQNIHEAIDSLVKVYGIEVSQLNLCGLFTYKYDYKPSTDMRQFYLANFTKGVLRTPNEKEKLHWLPIDEAIDKLSTTVESLGAMTRQIIKYPDTLWGGSFLLSRKEGKLISTVEEEFYPLRSNGMN